MISVILTAILQQPTNFIFTLRSNVAIKMLKSKSRARIKIKHVSYLELPADVINCSRELTTDVFHLGKQITEPILTHLPFYLHSVVGGGTQSQKWMVVWWPVSHPHPHFSNLCWPTSPSPSSWNTNRIDIRDQSKLAGAKSLTASTAYMCSLEREV